MSRQQFRLTPTAALRLFVRAFIALTLVLSAAAAALTLSMHASVSTAQRRLDLLAGQVAAESRVEVLGGQCSYGKVGNYVWHNEHYPHTLDLTPGCGLMAISKVEPRTGRTALGWRLAYVDLGTARTNAVFPMLDAEQISVLPDGSRCNASTWYGCPWNVTW